MTDYPHRTFVDQHAREIEVDESLSLKDAIVKWGRARKALWDHREKGCYGRDSYEKYREDERLLSNEVKIASENYDAAYYRTTGYWPSIISHTEFSPWSFTD